MAKNDRTAVAREVLITAELFEAALSETRSVAYLEALSDLPAAPVIAALKELRRTARFFPKPSEVREVALRLTDRLPPSSEEILALIRRADVEAPVCRRDGTLAYIERSWEWPEDASETALACAREVLRAAGDPVRNGERVFGWEQQAKAIAERVVQEATTALAVTGKTIAALPPAAA